MKQDPLSLYQPHGDPAPPEVLAKVMADVDRLRREMEDAGAWVLCFLWHFFFFKKKKKFFLACMLRAPQTCSSGPQSRRRLFLHFDRRARFSRKARRFSRGFTFIVRAIVIYLRFALRYFEWGRKLALATTLPIEVRPFRDQTNGGGGERPWRPWRERGRRGQRRGAMKKRTPTPRHLPSPGAGD